jgi:hypothetical protein
MAALFIMLEKYRVAPPAYFLHGTFILRMTIPKIPANKGGSVLRKKCHHVGRTKGVKNGRETGEVTRDR